MPPSRQPEPDSAESPRRSLRSALRWLLRFSAWSFFALFAAFVLALLVAVSAYFNRVAVINGILANYVKPFQVEVGKIEFLPLGTVTIEDLRIDPTNAKATNPLVTVPEAELTYVFRELRETLKFRTVSVNGPRIHLSEEALETLAPPSRGGSNPTPIEAETFAFFSEWFDIRGGEFFIDPPGAPPLRARWSLEVGSTDFDEGGWIKEPVRWRVEDLRIGEDGAGGGIGAIGGEATFHRDLSRFALGEIRVPSSEIVVTPEWFAMEDDGKTDALENEDVAARPAGTGLSIERLVVEPSTLRLSGFDGREGSPELPEVILETQFELEGVSLAAGRWESESPVALEFDRVSVGPPDNPIAYSDIVLVEAESLGSLVHDRHVDTIELITLNLVVDGQDVSPSGSAADATDPATAPGGAPAWTIDDLRIESGRLLASELTTGSEPLPRVETLFSASLESLRLGGEAGLASDAIQEIRLEQSRLWPPGVKPAETPPLVAWERADLGLRWNDFQYDGSIDRFTLRGPSIEFTDESLGDWIHFDTPRPDEPRPINRPVYRVRDLTVTGGTLVADSRFAEKAVPKIVSDFGIETDTSEDAPPFSYLTTLTNFELRNHAVSLEELAAASEEGGAETKDAAGSPVAEESVLRVDEITMLATAEQLQRSRQVGKVRLSGGTLTVGHGLEALLNNNAKPNSEGSSTEAAPAQPGPGPDDPEPQQQAPDQAQLGPAGLPAWLVQEFEIQESEVLFETLIPQIEGLRFSINTVLTDVPLSPDGLLAQDKLQKVELSGLEIRDPYDSFITVAELPTIFVEFSLAGLVKQEVHRIDLINPSLYVGQGLFWWVEYQRKFREQNEGSRIRIAPEEPGADAVEEEGAPAVDWNIDTIQATAGKIVIAPTGIPLGVVPFPFNASTSMHDGEIELVLEIPDEEHVYNFPEYKIQLHGLRGDVMFNVPVKDEDNNLVQKFYLQRIIWKEYEADDLFLSVTFDENGIYGDLGGYAYDGYVNAGFNFYLDKPGRWDAWIAGTDLSTGPITDRLAPQNFRMEGPISIELVSEGFRKQFKETTAEIQTTGPGWFDVTKLDAILENLPEDWTGWQTSLTDLALIALKRFDYDKGAGSLYLLGRDGLFTLRFAGPYGTRELNLHLHDERNTTAGVAPGPEADLEQAADSPETETD